MGHSYSFLDVQASIYGPGGNVSLAGDEAGVEQGGITVTPAGPCAITLTSIQKLKPMMTRKKIVIT